MYLKKRKINNKTPINTITIAEMVIAVLKWAASAEEEWANDNTPTQKKNPWRSNEKKVRGIDFVVHEYGT